MTNEVRHILGIGGLKDLLLNDKSATELAICSNGETLSEVKLFNNDGGLEMVKYFKDGVEVEKPLVYKYGACGSEQINVPAILTSIDDKLDTLASINNSVQETVPLLTFIKGNTESLQTELQTVQTKISDTISKLGELKTTLEAGNTTVNEISTKLDTITTEIGNVKTSVDTANTKLDGLKGDTEAIKTALGTVNENLTTINTELGSIKSLMQSEFDETQALLAKDKVVTEEIICDGTKTLTITKHFDNDNNLTATKFWDKGIGTTEPTSWTYGMCKEEPIDLSGVTSKLDTLVASNQNILDAVDGLETQQTELKQIITDQTTALTNKMDELKTSVDTGNATATDISNKLGEIKPLIDEVESLLTTIDGDTSEITTQLEAVKTNLSAIETVNNKLLDKPYATEIKGCVTVGDVKKEGSVVKFFDKDGAEIVAKRKYFVDGAEVTGVTVFSEGDCAKNVETYQLVLENATTEILNPKSLTFVMVLGEASVTTPNGETVVYPIDDAVLGSSFDYEDKAQSGQFKFDATAGKVVITYIK